jgi:hypothetical protein
MKRTLSNVGIRHDEMLELNMQLPKAKTPHEQESIKRTIAAARELVARMEKIQSTLACGQPVKDAHGG